MSRPALTARAAASAGVEAVRDKVWHSEPVAYDKPLKAPVLSQHIMK